MATRVTHSVRCRSKSNPAIFVDVEVLDAVSFEGPDGKLYTFLINSAQGEPLNPCIKDTTGDGNAKGSPGGCSRLSHMERVTSATDPGQFIDIEVLDAWTLQPPTVTSGDGPDETNDQQDDDGLIDSGDWDGAQHTFFTPNGKAVTFIKDNTGLNLGNQNQQKCSRSGHINMVTNAGNTDDHTEFSDNVQDVVPPVAHQYIATVKLDAICFSMPDGNTKALIVPQSFQDKVDKTHYTSDPFTGDTHAPPDNTDENIYVFIPESSAGPNLGSNPSNQQTGSSGPISQGLFWWIKKISGIPDPWFWYATVQTPLAWSYFGSGGSWGYRGFQLLPFFPVIWILGVNNPLQSMGSFGSPSLELCAEEGDFQSSGDMPNGEIYFPSRGIASGLTMNESNTFGPFGYLPVLDPPTNDGVILAGGIPTIWQLIGLQQPNLRNPGEPWDRQKNPYLWPDPKTWETLVKTFATKWNALSAGVNGLLTPVPTPPPGWSFATPYVKAGATNPGFQGGIQPFCTYSFPPEVFTPWTGWFMQVDQLDQSKWDIRSVLKRDQTNPGFITPPVTWQSEMAQGTGNTGPNVP